MASDNILILSDDNFEKEVVESKKTVLVDFWAPWCGPCKMLGPVLEELAEDMKDQEVVIAKMNVDENQATPSKFSVTGIPTMLVFKNGELAETMVGFRDKNAIKTTLENHK